MGLEESFDCDVVIVGSGISGSLIAWKLARAGVKVIVLEAGPRVNRAQGVAHAFAGMIVSTPDAAYSQNPWAPTPATLDPNNYLVQTGPDLFTSNYERVIGGTTWHWLGTALRLAPNDFRMRSTYGVGVDWPISYDELEVWYGVAENAIGVAGDSDENNGAPRTQPYPMPAHPLSYNDTLYAKAVQPLGLQVTATPQARVSIQEGYNKRPRCCGNAFCIPMCPIGAKYDATIHLNMAVAAGAEVRENAVVMKLAHDADGRITSVTYRNPDKQDTTLTARHVVVAAHAIETPKLLLMSASDAMPNGLANSSDMVGRHLMDHPTQLTYGLSPEPVGPYRAPLSTAGIETLRDGAFRKERGAFRIELGNDGWSWPGKDPVSWAGDLIQQGVEGHDLYRQVMELNARAMRTAALVEQLPDPESRVTLSDKVDAIGVPRPAVHYIIDDYAKQGLAAAREQFAAIYEAMNATQVTQVPDPQGAGHIMGTLRMGDDPKTSVTDSFGRAWDHPNLWLTGSGLFPTTGTANPTLTIAALALRTAPQILEALTGEG